MEDTLVSPQTAQLAREKSFKCGKYVNLYGSRDGIIETWKEVTPTQSLLQKWLREKQMDITVITDWGKKGRSYAVGLSYVNPNNEMDIWLSKEDDLTKHYLTYEEALEVGLQQALTFLP